MSPVIARIGSLSKLTWCTPARLRPLQHPHPRPHVFQPPGDIQRNAASARHQNAGIVWIQGCCRYLDNISPAKPQTVHSAPLVNCYLDKSILDVTMRQCMPPAAQEPSVKHACWQQQLNHGVEMLEIWTVLAGGARLQASKTA